MYKEKTGFDSTMVCFPYDDLAKWRAIYPEETFFKCFDELCKKWREGLEILDSLDLSDDPKTALVRDCAWGCYLHYFSCRNQVRYLMEGTPDKEKAELVRSEAKTALDLAKLAAKNPAFGFEAADHYYYTRQNLLEKIINCDYLADKL
jgi:hypothetical protein